MGCLGLIRKRVRRFWSDADKRMICAQTRASGVSVSRVARRYSLNANLIFKWLRDPRFAPVACDDVEADFLPVEIEAAPVTVHPATPQGSGQIEITLVSGHRLSISGCYDPDAVARLIRELSV